MLRTSLLPGLLKAVAYNESHRQPGVRLFEVGRVFEVGERGVITDVTESEAAGRVLSGESEHLAAVLAGADATAAVELVELLLRSVGRWHAPDAVGGSLARAEAGAATLEASALPGLHPGRAAPSCSSATWWSAGRRGRSRRARGARHLRTGRVAPAGPRRRCSTCPPRCPRRARCRGSRRRDIDLAFVVDERVPAEDLRRTLLTASEDVQPVVVELFDVFRSEQLGEGRKSLALPAALPGARPHPHRRRGRGGASRDHRGGGVRARGDAPGPDGRTRPVRNLLQKSA